MTSGVLITSPHFARCFFQTWWRRKNKAGSICTTWKLEPSPCILLLNPGSKFRFLLTGPKDNLGFPLRTPLCFAGCPTARQTLSRRSWSMRSTSRSRSRCGSGSIRGAGTASEGEREVERSGEGREREGRREGTDVSRVGSD